MKTTSKLAVVILAALLSVARLSGQQGPAEPAAPLPASNGTRRLSMREGLLPVAVLEKPAIEDTATDPKNSQPAPLTKLVSEAEKSNPRILAALRAWQAAAQVPSQVSTLPDPQLTFQQLSVASPRPFAGFTNNNFAYAGLGISQDLPFPGKLKLRGEAASREASAARDAYWAVRLDVRNQLKAAYFQLSAVQEQMMILRHDNQLLSQILTIAGARYRTGKGNQQDILRAQLQQTKLLRDQELLMQRESVLQARLLQILNRPPGSPAIVADRMTETALDATPEALLDKVRQGNPAIGAEQEMVRRQSLQIELARKDFYPDFNVQYMWQQTGPPFPNYYMLTLGVRVPIFRRRKQRPELAQAVAQLDQQRHQYEAQVQQAYFEVRDQFLQAETSSRLLKIDREGLIPQSLAAFRAGLAAYEAGTEDFESLFASFRDVLNLDEEYWTTLSEHETAVARIEQLTGADFHQGGL